MKIAEIHKFFMTLFAAIALAVTPSISFATPDTNCTPSATNDSCFPFEMEVSGGSSFVFQIAAKGVFLVDCGQSTLQANNALQGDTNGVVREYQSGTKWKVTQNTTNITNYVCVSGGYTGNRTIRIGGVATEYSTTENVPVFGLNPSFVTNLFKIDGSLGKVFPTLGTCGNPTAQPRFYQSFAGCENMEGVIPKDLFTSGANGNYTGVCGAPVSHMFDGTFKNAKNIVIPTTDGLFRGLSGAPAEYVFNETFYNAENSSNAVSAENNAVLPSNFFGSLSGSPAQYMFARTFHGCNKMKTEIPDGLFGNLSGTAATSMFDSTFKLCGNIWGEIPSQLFGTISGNATNMFNETFNECMNLGNQYGGPEYAYYIPKSLFLSFNGTNISSNMSNIFNNTKLMTSCPSGTRQWEPYPNFTAAWSSKVACEPIPEFTVTTSATNLFKFALSAGGVFNVDCGTGGTLVGDSTVSGSTITRNAAVSATTYWCEYADIASRTIKFTSVSVTGYSSGAVAAIRFGDSSSADLTADLVTGIEGSLGGVFPTIGAGNTNIPKFHSTFRNCSNLQGDAEVILAGVFDGVTGAPVSNMFYRTFYGCSGLTGNIPPGLFSGISGQLAASAFKETFRECSGITGSVPVGLFENITPTGNDAMILSGFQDIFYGTGLDTCCHEGGAVPISNNNWTRFTGDLLINNTSYYPWRVNDDNELAVACQTNSTDRQCAVPCDFADNLRVGAYSFALKKRDSNPITAEKTLNVKEPGVGGTETCYVPFSSTAPATINNNGIQGVLTIKVNGNTYYAEPAN